MQIDRNKIALAIQAQMHTPLTKLIHNQDFLLGLIQTGENESLYMVRRYSFMKPTFELVSSEDRRIVSLNLNYGVSGKTTLFTTERDVTYNGEITIYVGDPEATLQSLEDDLNNNALEGFQFPDEIRDKKIKDFLTEQNKYQFSIQVVHDTLSAYTESTIHVVLNYITLKDCIAETCVHLIQEGIIDEQDASGIYHLHDESNETPIAIRFRNYITNHPSVGRIDSGV